MKFFREILFTERCLICKEKSRDACCTFCFNDVPVSKTFPIKTSFGLSGAAISYETVAAKSLIYQLKFNAIKRAAEPLGMWLSAYAKAWLSREPSLPKSFFETAFIIPIPLSKQRERLRGFNQAHLIAEHFAKTFGNRVESRILYRSRHTKPHSETESRDERRKNIFGCFSLLEKVPPNIILIDDVVTTGSTFGEAAQTLITGGAKNILALAAASA